MKKLRNKKKTIAVIAALAGLSVASVGFASWVIQATRQTQTTGNITVTAATVVDKGFTLTATANSSNNSIRFDGKSGDANYDSSDNGGGADLDFEVDISLTATDTTTTAGFDALANTTISVSFTSSTLAEWVSGGYITTPIGFGSSVSLGTPATALSVSNVAISSAWTSTSPTRSATYKFTFGWGSLFGGSNPSSITSLSSDQLTGLKAIAGTTINDFTVTVTVTPA